MPASATDTTPIINREKEQQEALTGKMHYFLASYLLQPFIYQKNRSELISGIFRHLGHFHGVRVNSTYPALQEINSGRSTSRAFPFLCDLKTVVVVEGGRGGAGNSIQSAPMEQICFKDRESRAFVYGGAFEPTSEYKSVSPNCRAKCCGECTAGVQVNRFHITERVGAVCTHSHNQTYAGVKAPVQMSLSAERQHKTLFTSLCNILYEL